MLKRIILLTILLSLFETLFSMPMSSSSKTKPNSERYGYIDTTGKIAIKPIYLGASDFSDGIALVAAEKEISGIDKNGNIVIDRNLSQFGGPFCEGLAYMPLGEFYKNKIGLKKKKIGFINKKGEIVIEPVFYNANSFSQGLAAVQTEEGWGFIDKNGNMAIKPNAYIFRTECLGGGCKFSEGLYPVMVSYKWVYDKKRQTTVRKDRWGYIDINGQLAIQAMFDYVGNFSEGLAAFNRGWITLAEGTEEAVPGVFGYIDKKGKIVIKAKYKYAKAFSEGIAAVCNDEKRNGWGYINREGKKVIKFQFKKAFSFANGFAAVLIGDRWGFINKEGIPVIKPRFTRVKSFSEGFAAVEIDEKWGFIDAAGKYLVEPQFLEANSFSDGLAVVKVISGQSLMITNYRPETYEKKRPTNYTN